jgi:hypothetical protein
MVKISTSSDNTLYLKSYNIRCKLRDYIKEEYNDKPFCNFSEKKDFDNNRKSKTPNTNNLLTVNTSNLAKNKSEENTIKEDLLSTEDAKYTKALKAFNYLQNLTGNLKIITIPNKYDRFNKMVTKTTSVDELLSHGGICINNSPYQNVNLEQSKILRSTNFDSLADVIINNSPRAKGMAKKNLTIEVETNLFNKEITIPTPIPTPTVTLTKCSNNNINPCKFDEFTIAMQKCYSRSISSNSIITLDEVDEFNNNRSCKSKLSFRINLYQCRKLSQITPTSDIDIGHC